MKLQQSNCHKAVAKLAPKSAEARHYTSVQCKHVGYSALVKHMCAARPGRRVQVPRTAHVIYSQRRHSGKSNAFIKCKVHRAAKYSLRNMENKRSVPAE